MYSALKESLKVLSAEQDRQFQVHFVETKYLKRLISNDSDIVYGTKGVGKTALRRALTELNNDFYYKTLTIDLNQLSFAAVYDKLREVNKTVKNEMTAISRASWKNTLLNYSLLTFCDTLPETDSLRQRIYKVLESDGFIGPPEFDSIERSNYRILNTIENIFYNIISLPIDDDRRSLAVTSAQQTVVNKFPINDNISVLLDEAINRIQMNGKKVLVCIDGFDTIEKHDVESREAIFAGLIDAIYFFRLNEKISQSFCFKAFLPQELTLEANMVTWDTDKHSNNIHYLTWDENDFKLFIERRFIPFSRKRSTKFADIWGEFMPDKIWNSVHNTEEYTFDYILRHTLYRPRQVLNHIYCVIRAWDETNSPDKIQPSFVANIVAKTNKEMANHVTTNLLKVYPQIQNFLRSWQGGSPIIEVSKFKEKIKRYFFESATDFVNTDKVFDELFDFGIFGIYAKPKIKSNTKKMEFRFSFVGDNLNSSIHNATTDSDIIALAPMFKDYCGCQHSADGFIVPISIDNFDN